VCVRVSLCLCVYVSPCLYSCIYAYTHSLSHTRTCTRTHMYMHTHALKYVHMYIYTYTQTQYAHTHICWNMYTYIYIYIHTHTPESTVARRTEGSPSSRGRSSGALPDSRRSSCLAQVCATYIIACLCTMVRARVRRDSCMCVTWIIDTCDVAHSKMTYSRRSRCLAQVCVKKIIVCV